MNPAEPAAFTFQLSPEPPAVSTHARTPGLTDAMDAGWFGTPDEVAGETAGDDEAGQALVDALTDVATQTPPPARALPLPVRALASPPPNPALDLPPAQGRAPTLPRPITIDDPLTDPPLLVTPTSGHQISQLLTAPSEEPAPVIREPELVRASPQLPQSKPLKFPADTVQAPVAERPPAASPPAKPAAVREPKPPSAAVEAEAPREPVAAVKDTSTFKVIGYALVAMAFSYIGMSALVAWLSDSNAGQPGTAPVSTTAQAALTDVEASAEAAAESEEGAEAPTNAPAAPPAEAAAPGPAPAKVEALAKEQVAIEDLPVPAGLALGADKGVLKLVTPDAHTLYVDGEFAGRGPVRIVPLAPGKHTIKTRFDGEEKSYEANVQLGRMTRLTISAAK